MKKLIVKKLFDVMLALLAHYGRPDCIWQERIYYALLNRAR